MCLIALAMDMDRRFPLVVAANRDEFFSRPAARLAWWTPAEGGPAILGGRDLEGGGTWMGLTAEGRLAMVSNVRNPSRVDPAAPSRGRIVPQWLSANEAIDRFWMRTALSGHNGFNLIAADFRRGECFWASNHCPYPLRLERGIYSVSNAGLDTPWPKVEGLKSRLRAAIGSADSVDALATRLFDALANREEASDEQLPHTGVPLDVERRLSPAFIRATDNGYGTRCSTVIITERVRRHLITHVLERSFSASGASVVLLRRSQIRDWPPRYTGDASVAPPEQQAVSESELDTDAQPVTALPKRTRVRSLLKPEPGKRRRASTVG